jgi:hypothetical protein
LIFRTAPTTALFLLKADLFFIEAVQKYLFNSP